MKQFTGVREKWMRGRSQKMMTKCGYEEEQQTHSRLRRDVIGHTATWREEQKEEGHIFNRTFS